MTNSTNSKFRRILSSVLSAACVFSGTAVVGAATVAADTGVKAEALSAGEDVPFSWDNATVYFLLTDRFKNGDTTNDNAYGRKKFNGDNRASFHGGDFAGITQEINAGYFDNLGVNAIWLTAPYEQIHGYIQGGPDFGHYSYHGYYVLDYTETDAAYGTKEEFRTMVDTAHEHGIRIVMDIVMNHAGYNSMYDMNEYGYGTLKSGWENNYNSQNFSSYHDFIDYTNSDGSWAKWWGYDWIRSGISGFTTPGSDDQTRCLTDLPDFVTESQKTVGIPPLLQTKWTKEGTLSAKQAKYGTSNTVTGFITSWLAEWVREYGVDGFRCDTAKHVEKASWKQLKNKCVEALREWKQNNPSKKLDDLDFWMTGEAWGWNLSDPGDAYFTEGGFDSMINFETQGGGKVAQGSVAGTYQKYADSINSSDNFNGLSYLSSHDSTLARPGDMYALGSAFLLLPGAVQIYYGDETARPLVSGIPNDGGGGAGHSLRSDMPWDSLNQDLINHWGKVGKFRNNHLSVGGGANIGLEASSGVAFGRTYDKNGYSDKIAGVVYASANTDVSIDVSAIWGNGTQLHNYYDDTFATVSGGKVTFNSGAHGTILIEEPSGPRGIVKVKHIDKDSNKVIKEETLSGGIGESYKTSALSLEGFTVASTSGKTSGTYTETEINVTYYYTFDSNNYGYLTVKYVDAATGDEIAESDTTVGKVGNAYTTTPKDVKNYEVDESLTTNATGTYKKGTITVTYKYNYVEPTNLRVHYYNDKNWGSVYMYTYDERSGAAKEFSGKWPGTAMTAEGDGWFVAEADTEWAQVIFNNNAGTQEPSGGTQASGYECSGEVWIKGGKTVTTGKVSVKYITTDGKVLSSMTLTGIADGSTTYTTSAKTFDGYTLQSTPSNATGTYTEATITVTYTYKANSVTPTVLTNNSTIAKTSVPKDTSVSVKGKAEGGDGTYKYAFYYKKSTSAAWATIGELYGNTTEVSFAPASVATYYVKVNVKDGTGKIVTKQFTLKSTSPTSSDLQNTSTHNSTDGIVKGTAIKITGKATGGSGSYKYGFYYKKTTSKAFTTLGTEYGSATTATFTPGSDADYNIRINVKDSNGTIVTKQYKILRKGTTALVNNSTVSTTSPKVGDTVTIKGAASGSTSPYKYAYYYKKSTTSNYTTIGTEFGTATTATFKVGAVATYNVKVKVKDSIGNVVEKLFTVKSTSSGGSTTGGALTNASTISATKITKGSSVKVTGKATGGTSPYYYAFYYKKSTSSSWSTSGTEFGTATTATITPGSAGAYDIQVKIMDNTGETVTKDFTVVVS